MTAKRRHSGSEQKRKDIKARLKRTIIGIYALVIVGASVGLYHVLENRTIGPVGPPVTEEDPDVLAVLSAMESGSDVTVPIKDIEKIIPVRAKPAWKRHAANWRETGWPKIAVVIDDLGLSLEATQRLQQMEGPYTLAYLPYAEDLPDQTSRVKRAGHELMVHLPMQPKSLSADPGTNALLAKLGQEEFERRIAWNLSRFKGFVGVNNHMGSLLTEDGGKMVRVMMHLKQDGFLFLDSLTSPNSVGMRAARATGVPTIARDIFLDNVQRQDAIEEQLAKAERIARKRGYAIAIGHPYDVTLETLAHWKKTLRTKKLQLVPISQLVAEQEAQRQHAENMATEAE